MGAQCCSTRDRDGTSTIADEEEEAKKLARRLAVENGKFIATCSGILSFPDGVWAVRIENTEESRDELVRRYMKQKDAEKTYCSFIQELLRSPTVSGGGWRPEDVWSVNAKYEPEFKKYSIVAHLCQSGGENTDILGVQSGAPTSPRIHRTRDDAEREAKSARKASLVSAFMSNWVVFVDQDEAPGFEVLHRLPTGSLNVSSSTGTSNGRKSEHSRKSLKSPQLVGAPEDGEGRNVRSARPSVAFRHVDSVKELSPRGMEPEEQKTRVKGNTESKKKSDDECSVM